MLQITPETLAYLRQYGRAQAARLHAKAERRAAERKKRLAPQAFERLVETISRILVAGEPTKFEYEGACRHGLRVALINRGWTWSDANAAAIEVVNKGLEKVAAKRPTWLEGQIDFATANPVDRHYCARCGTPIPEERRLTGNAKYCDDLCKTAATQARARASGERVTIADHLARMALTAQQRVENRSRTCLVCSKPFLAAREGQDHCSVGCTHVAKVKHPPRPCAGCGATFKPERAKQKCCSSECGHAVRLAPKRTETACKTCSAPIVSTRQSKIPVYCSAACNPRGPRSARFVITCEETR